MKNLFIQDSNQNSSKKGRSPIFPILAFSFLALVLFIVFGPSSNSSNDDLTTEDSIKKEFPDVIPDHFTFRGEHINFSLFIKESMNDPDSYEFVDGNYTIISDSTYKVNLKFRGKNAYGALILNEYFAFCDVEGNLLELID